jgi:hypothetical protein
MLRGEIDDALEVNMRPSDAKLSAALREAGLTELAARAHAGEFNEFFGEYAAPLLLLADLLHKVGTPAALAVRARLINGEFDAGDESEEWAQSEEGQDAMRRLVDRKYGTGTHRPRPAIPIDRQHVRWRKHCWRQFRRTYCRRPTS